MTSKNPLRLAALALLLWSTLAHAGIDQAGTTAANFLSVGSNPATLSMGGAGLARRGELGLAAWNAASLAWLDQTQVVFSHSTLAETSQQEWVAVGGRMKSYGLRWALSGLYQGEGSFEGRDALGNSTGSFGVSSMALGGMLAAPFGEHAGAGLGIKWVGESLGDVSGSGFALDAGVTGESGLFSFAAAAQNAFGSMSYSGTSYPFPSNYGVGLAVHHPTNGLTLAFDANFPKAYYNDVRAGLEWRVKDYVAIRTGYRMEMGGAPGEPLTGPTFGIGAGANGFWFDYGYLVSSAGASGQHRLGLTFSPGAMAGAASGFGQSSPAPAVSAPKPRPAKKVERAVAPEPKKSAKKSEPVAVETSAKPVRAPEPQRVEIPRVAPPAAAPAPTTAPTTVKSETPKPVVFAPTPVKSEPAIVAPPVAKSETPKPVVTPPAPRVEAPKPVVTPPAPRVEAPKPVVTPPPVKVEPAKSEPTIAAPAPVAVAPPVVAPRVEPAKSEPLAVAMPPEPKSEPVIVSAAAKNEPRVVSSKHEAVAKAVPRPAKVKVQNGESMADIAKRWNTTVPAIMMENNLVSERVKNGMQLKLPAELKR